MGLENIILSEVRETEEKHHMTSLICGIYKYMNSLTKQKETHKLRRGTYGCQVEGIVRDFEKVMYTLLYLKWITNKDLLYSTWNSCSMLCGSLDGRGVWGRMHTCICVAESLCGPPGTMTTLLIGYMPIQNKKLKKSFLLPMTYMSEARASSYSSDKAI